MINKRVVLTIAVLMAIQAAMLAYTAFRLTPVYDEPGHFVAGVTHWQCGTTELYRVNPPMPRMVMTAIPYLLGARVDYRSQRTVTLDRKEIHLGFSHFEADPKRAMYFLGLARLTAIVWPLIGTLVIFRWSRELNGDAAGLFSVALWCFSPLILANSQLILPDVAAASLGLLAAYSFYHWLKKPTFAGAFLTGLGLGAAELTKFTLIILFPLWVLIWLLWSILEQRTLIHWKRQSLQILFLFCMALLVINAGYNFDGTFTKLGDYKFVSDTFRGANLEDVNSVGRNRFFNTWMGAIPIPLPKDVLQGMDVQQLDFDDKTSVSFLRGELKTGGGWYYYYVYAYLIKEPIGFLLILFVSFLTAHRMADWRVFSVLLPVPILIFLIVSAQTAFNHHLRYILPAIPFLAVWAGRLMSPSVLGVRMRWVAVCFLLSGMIASASVYPYSYAYFNCLVGGSENGYRHLAGSNVEWGQSGHLATYLIAKYPGIQVARGLMPNYQTDFSNVLSPPNFTPTELRNSEAAELIKRIAPGWYAIPSQSLTHPTRPYYYFVDFEAAAVVGYTIRVYYLTEDDISKWAHSLQGESGRSKP